MGCYGFTAATDGGPCLCEPCSKGVAGATCVLCFQPGGALRSTVDGRWCHMSCGLWCQEVVFLVGDSTVCLLARATVSKPMMWGAT
jgi:hypothetical protein